MTAIALIAIYAVPVLFAYACHEAGQKGPVAPQEDEIDHNFDSMWESVSR